MSSIASSAHSGRAATPPSAQSMPTCASCRQSLDLSAATAVSLLTRGEDGNGISVSRIELSREFSQRYVLRQLLGVGGMGMVYRATDRREGATVAIKFMRPEPSEEGLLRFRQERELL